MSGERSWGQPTGAARPAGRVRRADCGPRGRLRAAAGRPRPDETRPPPRIAPHVVGLRAVRLAPMADRDAPARPTALEAGRPADPPAGAGGFVREATGDDLEAIGRVHAASMLASLRAAHASAHDGAPLPAGVVAMIAAPVLAAGWERAVLSPPSPRHRVLVATEGGEVVGLLGLAPTRGLAQGDPGAEPEPAVEITALGVDPARQRSGHGSRLLAAAADHARADGARVLLVWAVRGDESVRGLLAGAGLERTRSRRELPVGRGVTEECWGAAL